MSSLCCWASTMSFTVVWYWQLIFILWRCCSSSTAVIWGIHIWVYMARWCARGLSPWQSTCRQRRSGVGGRSCILDQVETRRLPSGGIFLNFYPGNWWELFDWPLDDSYCSVNKWALRSWWFSWNIWFWWCQTVGCTRPQGKIDLVSYWEFQFCCRGKRDWLGYSKGGWWQEIGLTY